MLRAIRAFSRVVPKRGYAAGAPAQATSDDLVLTLSSPSRAFFTNEVVKQVDVPTMAGTIGVLAKHVPTIGVIKPGLLQVYGNDGNVTKLFVSSGTVSMNVDGSCQVLAEEAYPIAELDEGAAKRELEDAQRKSAEGGSELEKAEAQIRIEVAEALVKAISGQ